MKAWKIRKARKKLAKWNDYIVSEASKVFGAPYERMVNRTFKAKCAEHALRRVLKLWERKNHCFHEFDYYNFPTTRKWGKFEVFSVQENFYYYFR